MGLEYTSIRVMDLEKSLNFYTKDLGRKLPGNAATCRGNK